MEFRESRAASKKVYPFYPGTTMSCRRKYLSASFTFRSTSMTHRLWASAKTCSSKSFKARRMVNTIAFDCFSCPRYLISCSIQRGKRSRSKVPRRAERIEQTYNGSEFRSSALSSAYCNAFLSSLLTFSLSTSSKPLWNPGDDALRIKSPAIQIQPAKSSNSLELLIPLITRAVNSPMR